MVARSALCFLLFADFSRQIARPQRVLQVQPLDIAYHVTSTKLPGPVARLTIRRKTSKPCKKSACSVKADVAQYNVIRHLEETWGTAPAVDVLKEFPLLVYLQENWIQHCRNMSPNYSRAWLQFSRLVDYDHSNPFIPPLWPPDTYRTSDPVLRVIVQHRHHALLRKTFPELKTAYNGAWRIGVLREKLLSIAAIFTSALSHFQTHADTAELKRLLQFAARHDTRPHRVLAVRSAMDASCTYQQMMQTALQSGNFALAGRLLQAIWSDGDNPGAFRELLLIRGMIQNHHPKAFLFLIASDKFSAWMLREPYFSFDLSALLFDAVKHNRLRTVRLVLDVRARMLGEPIGLDTKMVSTALAMAARTGHVRIARLLVQSGASKTFVGRRTRPPVEIAALSGDLKLRRVFGLAAR